MAGHTAAGKTRSPPRTVGNGNVRTPGTYFARLDLWRRNNIINIVFLGKMTRKEKCHEETGRVCEMYTDFPEEGVMFRDVTSVLQDADGLHLAIDTMQELIDDLEFDVVVGPESRGFIFGTPLLIITINPLF